LCTLEKYEVVSLPNIEIDFGINAIPCKWNKLENGLHENFILCSCTWSSNKIAMLEYKYLYELFVSL